MRRILVTGATGYIGSNLVKALSGQDEVHVLIREDSTLELLGECIENIKCYRYDGNIEGLDEIFEVARPDIVIHLASKFIVEHSMMDVKNIISSNILLGTQLLECCKRHNIKYFINTGTYWQNYNGDTYNPVNLYAASKQAFEDIIKYYVETSELRVITLRLTDTYGPFDPRGKVLNLIKKLAKSNETLGMSPGMQELGLVYINDVIKAYFKAMNEITLLIPGQIKVYIVRPYSIYSLQEVVHIYEKVINKKLNIQWGKRAYRPREVMKIESNLKNILLEDEMFTLVQGLKEMNEIEEKSMKE